MTDICGLVWNEYEFLFNTYEGFNSFSFTLNGWSVTVALAAIFAVYFEKLGAQGKVLLWSAALCALFFWGLDGLWKLYQDAYIARIEDLEGIADCTKVEAHSYSVYQSWKTAFAELKCSPIAWAYAALRTLFPHAFVLALGVFLAVRFPPGPAKTGG